MVRDDRGLIAVFGHGLEAPDHRVDIGLPADVDVDHALDLQELDLRRASLGERRGVDDLHRAIGVGPVEHLDPVGKSLLRGDAR